MVDLNREAYPVHEIAVARLARDHRRQSHHLALQVDQRAAAVAEIERRVGLDQILLDVALAGKLRVGPAHHAERHRNFLAEQHVADGEHMLAGRERARRAERGGPQRVKIGAQHGDIAEGSVAADQLRFAALAVGQDDLDPRHPLQHMRGGHNRAAIVEHDARRQRERLVDQPVVARLIPALGADQHDRGRDAGVSLNDALVQRWVDPLQHAVEDLGHGGLVKLFERPAALRFGFEHIAHDPLDFDRVRGVRMIGEGDDQDADDRPGRRAGQNHRDRPVSHSVYHSGPDQPLRAA